MYFDSNYTQTVANEGYEAPDFSLVALAFGLRHYLIEKPEDLHIDMVTGDGLCIIEIAIDEKTYVFPKLAINKPIQDQDPPIDRELHAYILNLQEFSTYYDYCSVYLLSSETFFLKERTCCNIIF